MSRTRVSFTITVDLDPVPGAFHDPAYVHAYLQGTLDQQIPHYNPEVTLNQ